MTVKVPVSPSVEDENRFAFLKTCPKNHINLVAWTVGIFALTLVILYIESASLGQLTYSTAYISSQMNDFGRSIIAAIGFTLAAVLFTFSEVCHVLPYKQARVAIAITATLSILGACICRLSWSSLIHDIFAAIFVVSLAAIAIVWIYCIYKQKQTNSRTKEHMQQEKTFPVLLALLAAYIIVCCILLSFMCAGGDPVVFAVLEFLIIIFFGALMLVVG